MTPDRNTKEAFRPPTSGRVVGVLVDVLRLRRTDAGKGKLDKKTAQRYFAGRRIKDVEKRELFEAFGRALIEADVIPIPDLIAASDIPAATVLASALAETADGYDHTAGRMSSASAPVRRVDLAALPYLRIAVIDLAVRAGMWLHLAESRLPLEEVPVWAKDRGGAMFLRGLLDRCGRRRPKRGELAKLVRVSEETVDAWLDGGSRPDGEENVEYLAAALARLIEGEDASRLGREIRMTFALSALADRLAALVGREAVQDLAGAFMRFTKRIAAGLNQGQLRDQLFEEARRNGGPLGMGFDPNRFFARHLWRQESHPIWRADLDAVAEERVFHRLQHLMRVLGDFDKGAAELERMMGMSKDEASKLAEMTAQIVQADPAITRYMAQVAERSAPELARDPGFRAWLGRFHGSEALSEHDHLRAVEEFRRAVVAQPQDAQCHFNLGAMLGMTGRIDEALAECHIASQLRPGWDSPLVEVGIILLRADRRQEALRHLEQFAAAFPEMSPHLAYHLGLAREGMGLDAAALQAYERAIAAKPDYALALDCAARCAFLIGDHTKGLRLAKEAERLGQRGTYRDWQSGVYRLLARLKKSPGGIIVRTRAKPAAKPPDEPEKADGGDESDDPSPTKPRLPRPEAK